jgi:hypothetical protein
MEDIIKINIKHIKWKGVNGFIWLRMGTKVAGFTEYCNEHLGSIQCWEFLEKLRN